MKPALPTATFLLGGVCVGRIGACDAVDSFASAVNHGRCRPARGPAMLAYAEARATGGTSAARSARLEAAADRGSSAPFF